MSRLKGKVALVTGGGSGIGAAIARRLASEGAHIWVTGRQVANTHQVVESIQATGDSAVGRVVDVRDSRAIAAVVTEIMHDAGRLDVLVANAARAGMRAYNGPLLEVTDEEWEDIVATNLSGVFYSAREAAKVMIPQGSGCIVTVGSVNSFVPESDVTAYAATKGGVVLLTRSLARDLGKYGIRMNGIAPGGTDTENILAAIETLGLTPKQLVGRIPLGRRAAPEGMAAVVAFLASDDASYINGQMIVVDGGQLCT